MPEAQNFGEPPLCYVRLEQILTVDAFIQPDCEARQVVQPPCAPASMRRRGERGKHCPPDGPFGAQAGGERRGSPAVHRLSTPTVLRHPRDGGRR